MSRPISFAALRAAALALLVAALPGTPRNAFAQQAISSAFTYQGELATAGTPATGTYDIRFRLYDAATGGNQIGSTLCSDDLAVAAGRFVTSLDFGAAAFAGQQRFLEIEVREDSGLDCSDATGYSLLSPRQELTATPNATFAKTAATAITATTAATATNAINATNATNATNLNGQPASFFSNAANLTGTLADARLSNNIARLNSNQTFTGLLNFTNPGNTFTGNGSGLTNLNGGSIGAGTLPRSSLNDDVRGGLGSVVVDLTLTGSAATFSQPNFVAVSGSYAYVVASGSNRLQVFDISSPSVPVLVGNADTAGRPYSVTVSGSFAYVVNFNANTLQIFNISNPAAPALAGSIATGAAPTSVAVLGSYAYVAHYESFFSTNTLRVYDISNPAAPTQVGSIPTGGRAYSIAAAGSYVYFADNGLSTLRIYNVSNPASPTLAGIVSTWSLPTSIAVSGNFAYVVSSNTGGRFQIFDISNPTAPALVGQSAAGSIPWGISVSGSRAYIVNRSSATLQVFNVSNPAAPALEAQIATGNQPEAVATSGSLACVVNSGSNSLQVFSAPAGIGFSQRLAGSSLIGVNGGGLTGVNAAQLGGQPAAFYTNASNLTTGTLANAQTSGTSLSNPSTLVLRDASGNFSAGTITAALSGNATSATTATNSTQLNGQPASFYTNASNITTGTLAAAQVPNLDASKISSGTLAAARIPGLDASIIATGTLSNARTSGTDLNTPNTLIVRDASGNFSAGTISATLNGNAATATTATSAINATQLNGQPGSFYTNASNMASGTLSDARLSPNVAMLNNQGISQFSGNIGVGMVPSSNARLQVLGGFDAAIVDQSQLASTGVSGGSDQWQSFTAALTGRLSAVRLSVGSPLQGSSSPGTIQIYAGEGTGGPLLSTQQVTYVQGLALRQFDFSEPPNVTAGATYTIRFSAPVVNVGWVSVNSSNPYAGGRLSPDPNWDAVFQTLIATPRTGLRVSDSGVSIGSAAAPPAINGLSVSGDSVFAAGLSAQSFTGSGSGITNLNASNITTGTLANARTTGTDLNTPSTLVLRDASGNFAAGIITASLNGNATTSTNATQLNGQTASFYTNATNITTGTLANARTTGTNLNTPSTLVLRDASGNFTAGTITGTLNGNATTATTANAAINSSQLNGQPASFYTNAANLTGSVPAASLTSVPAASLTGTIAQAALPVVAWSNTALSANAITSATFTPIAGTSQVIAMRQGVAVISWSTSARCSATENVFSLRVKAVTNGVTTTGTVSSFWFNQANVHATISGNAMVSIPSTGNTTFTLEVARGLGAGAFTTDNNDSLSATIINIGQ